MHIKTLSWYTGVSAASFTAMMLLLLAVAAIVPAVSGFGGGKSTVFISCDANSPASPTTHLEAAITQLLPLDPPLILNATCDFKSLALQSYTNIIVNINGGSTSSYDIKALADLCVRRNFSS